MQHFEAQHVVGPTAPFGEGPLWDDRTGVLWWTDIPSSTVHRFDPASGEDQTIEVAQNIGAIVLRASGGLAVAARDGFAVMGDDGSLEMLVALHADDPTMRMNDGKVDPAGRFYASTMAFNGVDAHGELTRLDADLSVHVQAEQLVIGNGLDWSADGLTLYFTDTMSFGIDGFDIDPATGDLSNRRRLFDIAEEHGWPDGFCIDNEGALWVAMWKGSSVRRYSCEGELLAIVHLPVSNVTCASFGGSSYDTLYITTAQAQFSGGDHPEPLGGAIFSVKPGVCGRPPNMFAG